MKRFIHFVLIAALLWWVWDKLFPGPPSVFPEGSAGTQLSEAEQDYYRQVFDYTMTVTKPGQSYEWKSYSGRGTITVSKVFKSKSDASCRNFSEVYTIGRSEHSADGVACKREGRDGWCRLTKTDAQTCAMEPPSGPVEETLKDTHGMLETGKGLWAKIQAWVR